MNQEARTPSVTITDLPDFLTIEEAADLLRIGRSSAYDAARRWELTDGRRGIPNVRVGRHRRVPKAAILRLTAADLTTETA